MPGHHAQLEVVSSVQAASKLPDHHVYGSAVTANHRREFEI